MSDADEGVMMVMTRLMLMRDDDFGDMRYVLVKGMIRVMMMVIMRVSLMPVIMVMM